MDESTRQEILLLREYAKFLDEGIPMDEAIDCLQNLNYGYELKEAFDKAMRERKGLGECMGERNIFHSFVPSFVDFGCEFSNLDKSLLVAANLIEKNEKLVGLPDQKSEVLFWYMLSDFYSYSYNGSNGAIKPVCDLQNIFTLASQCFKYPKKEKLEDVAKRLSNGEGLAFALGRHLNDFPRFAIRHVNIDKRSESEEGKNTYEILLGRIEYATEIIELDHFLGSQYGREIAFYDVLNNNLKNGTDCVASLVDAEDLSGVPKFLPHDIFYNVQQGQEISPAIEEVDFFRPYIKSLVRRFGPIRGFEKAEEYLKSEARLKSL